MKKRKPNAKQLLLGGVLAASLALSAAAAQGSESDPLVTLGYLTEQFLPQVLSQVETRLADRDKTLDSKLQAMADRYAADLDQRLSGSDGGADSGGSVSSGFVVVRLTGGQTLSLAAGSELLFREGSALCAAPSSPGLVDMTDGGILEDRSAPQRNHLYLATDGGRGLAASDAVTVLVRGEYTVE